MKRTHRCPKCNHGRILYIATVADRYGDHTHSDASTPMKIAHYQKEAGSLLGMAITTTERAGTLEAGVCRQCGYTELYTKDPQHIVVDGTNVRELVAPS
jgi:predicted nucleic-acid-binding Zn-ribbon protein